jgi:dipeptidyl aminopeptidase/acylaminoacyl peptidase
MSPDGKKIIYLQNVENKTALVTLDFETGKMNTVYVSDNIKFKFRLLEWANNDKILFSIAAPYYRYGVPTMETRLMARKADCSEKARELVNPRSRYNGSVDHVSQFQDNIINLLPDDPQNILIGVDLEEPNLDTVYKLNIDTLFKTVQQHYKKDVRSWITDQQGRVRVGEAFNNESATTSSLIYNLENKEWKEVWKKEVFSGSLVSPLGFGKDPDILYVRADYNGRNAIFRVDVSKPDLPMELVAKDDKYDIDGSLIYSSKTRDVVGVYHSEADGGRIYWDDSFKKLQAAIDKALPDTTNYLIDSSQDELLYIIFSTSDTMPGEYFLLDNSKNSLNLIATTYPQLDGRLQGNKKTTYSARDGKTIEAYLTLPAGYTAGTPYPCVIFPHGGPMARDYGEFDYWAEYFASKGIIVLQPNFRGSSGYGREFEMEAIQNYGLTMQDDLTDAANWLIEQKLADPERIAIAGGSYGGYAALMGAVKTPDLFRCAISFAGVSDLLELRNSKRRYIGYSVVRKQLGTDRKQLEAVSPIMYVDRIKVPILLGHGDEDRTVPVEQSREMAKALKKYKKKHVYIELEHGDHSLSFQKNRHEFFSAMDKFLNKYLLK